MTEKDIRFQQPEVLIPSLVPLSVFTASVFSCAAERFCILQSICLGHFSRAQAYVFQWSLWCSEAAQEKEMGRKKFRNFFFCSGAEYDHSCMVTTPQPINLVLPCLYRKNYFHFLGIWIVPQGFMRLCYGWTKSIWFHLKYSGQMVAFGLTPL